MKSTDKTFSIGIDLDIPEVQKVKEYTHKEFGNYYNFPPHIGITMTAIDPDFVEKAFDYSINYFSNKGTIKTKLSNLIYEVKTLEPDETLIKLKVLGPELYNIHKEMLGYLSTNYKNDYIREKDMERIESGKVSGKKLENIKKYGFSYVMDMYNPHITVAVIKNKLITSDLKKRISTDLSGVEGGDIEIKNIHIIYHTSPKLQTDTKVIRREDIVLG